MTPLSVNIITMISKINLKIILFSLFSLQLAGQKIVKLDGSWDFKTDLYEEGIVEKWFSDKTDYSSWDKMSVPGNWDIENEYAYHIGTAWYHMDLNVDIEKGKTYFLKFESVYNESEIFLNGEKVGENYLGFLPFNINITNYLIDGRNNLTVRVNNSFKRGAIWNWGGIRRSVRLEISDGIRVLKNHITAVPDLEKEIANISNKLTLNNYASEVRKFRLVQEIKKGDKTIWDRTSNVELMKNESKMIEFSTSLKNPELWDPNHPNLYLLATTIYYKNKLIWKEEYKFGIRNLEVRGTSMFLNGKEIKPMGINLVPDDRIHGNTYPSSRIKEDVSLLKSLGVQFARLSHLPLPEEFLNELDRQGIMVIEEVSLWGKDKWVDPENKNPFNWLKRMIDEKYNHPSVVGWSVGNEIGYKTANPKVMEYVEKAINLARTIDTTRLAVYVSNSAGEQKNDPAIFSDLVLINRYGDYKKSAEKIHDDFPNKAIFFSEIGKAPNSENPDNDEIPITDLYNGIRQLPYVIGASLWTLNDYRSTWHADGAWGVKWTTPKSENRAWGVVTTFREKKKQFVDLQKEHLPFTFEMNNSERKIEISTEKRPKTTFPYYDYSDYRIEIKEFSLGNELIKKDQKLMSSTQSWVVLLHSTDYYTISFLDSQGNNIYEESFYLSAPSVPEIQSVHTATSKIRVVFDGVPNARYYVANVIDEKGEIEVCSDTTTNFFAEIDNLDFGKKYIVEVAAFNEAGTTISNRILATTDEKILPPVIWSVRSVENGIMVSYSSAETDLTYTVRYGTKPGDYHKELEFRNYGVLKLPNLVSGKNITSN